MKRRPLPDALLRTLARHYGTPLYAYRAETIRDRYRSLAREFDVVRYAQKANSNLGVLRLLRELGADVDAVSAGEVRRALLAGFEPARIQLSADLFDREALSLLAEMPVTTNLGSPDMIEQLAAVRPGAAVRLRLNPGFGHGHGVKVSTGGPHSKHGIWHEDLEATLARARAAGLRVIGVHVHIGSGSDFEHLSRVREALARAAVAVGPELETLSTGGGLPTPYRPEDRRFDLARFGREWRATRDRLAAELGRSLELETEPGRFVVAESGVLLSEVRGTKRSGGVEYVLVDAGFGDLLRPAMYGAYHHVSIVGRDSEPTAPRVVAGPLCESADMFTQAVEGRIDPRPLPRPQVGDLVCLHDAGAYGASMASNYNSRPLAAEVLVEGEEHRLIRRRQTFEEMVATELEVLGPETAGAGGSARGRRGRGREQSRGGAA